MRVQQNQRLGTWSLVSLFVLLCLVDLVAIACQPKSLLVPGSTPTPVNSPTQSFNLSSSKSSVQNSQNIFDTLRAEATEILRTEQI